MAERVQWIECDLLTGLEAVRTFDFIVSNPPYVSTAEYEKLPRDVKNFEPREALLAGPKGTEVIERLILQAAERLRTGGHLLIEISPMIHSAVQALLAAAPGLQPGPTVKDLARAARGTGEKFSRTARCPLTDSTRTGRYAHHDGLIITGGVPLQGTVSVSGAKNAALPMMAATILADAPVELLNVPRLTDVHTMGLLLRQLGVDVARHGDRMVLHTVDTRVMRARYALVRRMRAGFCVLGPLLARRGRAVVPLPGGCDIGDRPVDLHLRGLAALGADLRLERGYIVATARQLRGATIDLCGPRGPTVTGTANVLCAAVLARGRTVIHGAAREPEIVDLGRMLNSLGARICGLGTQVPGNRRGGAARRRTLPHHSRSHRSRDAHACRGHHGRRGERRGIGPRSLESLAGQAGSERSLDQCTGRSRGRAGRRPAAARERVGRTVSGSANGSSSTLDGIHGDGDRPEFRGGSRVSHALGPCGRTASDWEPICNVCPAACGSPGIAAIKGRRWRPPICGPAPP